MKIIAFGVAVLAVVFLVKSSVGFLSAADRAVASPSIYGIR